MSDAFLVSDLPTLRAFIGRFPFATLVTAADDGPVVTHLPLLLDAGGPYGTLRGHFARSNPHGRLDHARFRSVAVFHGPQAYISPAWYDGMAPAVPTWNYAVVHATGHLAMTDNRERTAALLAQTVVAFESSQPIPWENRLLPELNDRLTAAVAAFDLRIDTILGRFKLGQNRSAADRAGMVAALDAAGDAGSASLAAFLRERDALSTDGV